MKADGIDGATVGLKVRGRSVSVRVDEGRGRIGLRGTDGLLAPFRDAPAAGADDGRRPVRRGVVREMVGRPFDLLPRGGVRVGGAVVRSAEEFKNETVFRGTITTTVDGRTSQVKVAMRQTQTITVSDKNPVGD